jgi:hypothetical protein
MGLAGMLFLRQGAWLESSLPPGQTKALGLLCEVKAVVPLAAQAQYALCDYCGLHSGRVARSHEGLMVECPECGLAPVEAAALRRWRFDEQWLIRKLRGALDINTRDPITPLADGVWDIGLHRRRSVVLGRSIHGILLNALQIFHGHTPRRSSWVITPRPLGKVPAQPLAGTATWWHLEERFALHGLALRHVSQAQGEGEGAEVREPAAVSAVYAVHGPFTADFSQVLLDDWPHGPIRLTAAQAQLFAVLWRQRAEAQSAEFLMRQASLSSDRPIDLFKIKRTNRGDLAYEGPLHAYERLVVRQRRLGLYQLIWAV